MGLVESRVKYFFSDPDILTSPTSDVKVSDCEVSFTLNNETLNQLKRAGAALGHNSLSIRPDGKSLKLSIFAEENPTGNTYDTVIAGTFPEGAQFDLILNIQHLKMIAGDYEVEVSSKGVAHLTHDAECKMEYWIALEKSSKWEG